MDKKETNYRALGKFTLPSEDVEEVVYDHNGLRMYFNNEKTHWRIKRLFKEGEESLDEKEIKHRRAALMKDKKNTELCDKLDRIIHWIKTDYLKEAERIQEQRKEAYKKRE